MIRRVSGLRLGLLAGGLATAIAIGCGGDDENDGTSPTAGRGGDGGATSGKGGTSNAGDTGSGEAGEPGTSAGGNGEGGATTVVGADIDDVVTAVCEWEFRCCDEGEVRYRLAPTATDAAECAEDFIFEMRESNSTSNPYVAGNAAGLLGLLGFTVNLDRVQVNEANAAGCVEQWDDLDCNSPPDPDARCDGSEVTDPCALNRLFEPVLELDDACTLALTEGVYGNDIECLPGSTCLETGHPDNPNDFPSCVKRGIDGEPCTSDDDCDYDFLCNDGGDCEEKAGAGDDCSFEDPEQPAAGEEAVQCKAGLTCHPVDLTCTEPCSLGFRCANDGECPAGSSCAPLTVENDTTSFMVCRAPGESATARCDSDVDCIETRYCDGSVCQADVAQAVACTKTAMCPEGMYCSPISGCTATIMPAASCVGAPADACGPEPARCVVGACSAGPVDVGDACDQDADCTSGLCELAGPLAVSITCIAGGEENDSCDAVVGNGTAQRCAPGLYCDGTGQCAPQSGPGGACEDPDTSLANDAICSNASCADQWDELMCTDAAVPEANDGTNVTCDGS